jgi:hypothetical protein
MYALKMETLHSPETLEPNFKFILHYVTEDLIFKAYVMLDLKGLESKNNFLLSLACFPHFGKK